MKRNILEKLRRAGKIVERRLERAKSLITLALTPRAGQPLPLHVLHATADVVNTSVDLSPSWTLEKATSIIGPVTIANGCLERMSWT